MSLLIAITLCSCSLLGPQKAPEKAPTPEKAPPQSPIVEDRATYEDGEYKGKAAVGKGGWQGEVELEVKKGKITEVEYDEVNEKGDEKSEDEEYNKAWEEQAGTNAKVYREYERALIDTQAIEDVDAITGATGTHKSFTEAVKDALERGPKKQGG